MLAPAVAMDGPVWQAPSLKERSGKYFRKGKNLVGKGYNYLNSTRKQVSRMVKGQESLNTEAMRLEQYTVDSLNNQNLNLNEEKAKDYWGEQVNG